MKILSYFNIWHEASYSIIVDIYTNVSLKNVLSWSMGGLDHHPNITGVSLCPDTASTSSDKISRHPLKA